MYFVRRINRCITFLGASSFAIASPKRMHAGSTSRDMSGITALGAFPGISWIDEFSPRFPVKADQVHFLHDPQTFYSTLQAQIRGAKKRIVIASLYLGTDKLETDLVNNLSTTLENCASDGMEVQILLDYTRGTRGSTNSCSLLRPLIEKHPDKVRVSLYHTPDLRGLLRRMLPERFNETVGLQHMKIYLFDDNVILSGANLSDSYFTNRQDRYVMFRGTAKLANFFSDLVHAVSSISYHLQSDSSFALDESCATHPYEGSNHGAAYREEGKRRIMSVIESARDQSFNIHYGPKSSCNDKDRIHSNSSQSSLSCKENIENSNEADTVVYPLLQMPPFGICMDQHVTEKFLKSAPADSVIHLASGYFNLTSTYRDIIVNQSQAQFKILTAAPKANGFYGSRGISGFIPDAYSYVERQFLQEVTNKCSDRITLREHLKENWTFHAKGLWHTLAGQTHPSTTFIGSPNFGYRSVCRDLEAQVLITTANEDLQRRLYEEQEAVYDCSTSVNLSTFAQPHRHIPLWVTYVTPLIANFF